MNAESGNNKIPEEAVIQCAADAALKTKGVYGLYCGLTGNITKTILGRDSTNKGVKINQSDDKVLADIHVIIQYGYKIPDVAWNIQENVKQEIEKLTDAKVEFVNIHVQGVHFEDEEA